MQMWGRSIEGRHMQGGNVVALGLSHTSLDTPQGNEETRRVMATVKQTAACPAGRSAFPGPAFGGREHSISRVAWRRRP
jgi:hypothetical protein